jgi:hypothetical protein
MSIFSLEKSQERKELLAKGQKVFLVGVIAFFSYVIISNLYLLEFGKPLIGN